VSIAFQFTLVAILVNEVLDIKFGFMFQLRIMNDLLVQAHIILFF
jgi:hypothetical protein